MRFHMKKILFALFTLAAISFASKPLVLEVCNDRTCYLQIIADAKSWTWINDFNGKRYIRVYLYNSNKMIDIQATSVKVKK